VPWPPDGEAYICHRRLGCAFGVIALALTACASGSDARPSATSSPLPAGEGRSVVVGSVAPCVPPSAIPVTQLPATLPAGVALPAGSRLLSVDVTGGVTTIVGETRVAIGPLKEQFRRPLTRAGREIFSEDNEGIEAELFFTLPGGGIGIVRETRARCPVGVTRFSVSLN
jgi:hypothetical protein